MAVHSVQGLRSGGRRFLLVLLSLTGVQTSVAATCALPDRLSQGRELEVRSCLVRELRRAPLPSDVTEDYGDYIQTHPQIGYDLVLTWDRFALASVPIAPPPPGVVDLDKLASLGDEAMMAKDFKRAFETYTRIERELRALPSADRKRNTHFRFYILHSMARALYGMGEFRSALTVYGWLPPVYPDYRQVLFERMWTAFRLGRTDVALGSIASQRSSYFGKYLEPESYLVWIYILRNLCRDGEIKRVRSILTAYERDLTNGRFGPSAWAESDPIARSWVQVLSRAEGRGVSAETKTEKFRLERLLKSRFATERTRLLEQIGKVTKFSYLALGAKITAFPPTRNPGTYEALLKRGFEMWPGEDAEDWWDEVGGHRYINDRACGRE